MLEALVFFDLDGTLLNDKSQVDEEVKEAVLKLKKNGYEPVIATGRTMKEINYILDETGINSIICMNGQMVIFEGEIIHNNLLSKDTVSRFVDKLREMGDEASFYNKDEIKLTGINDRVLGNYRAFNLDLPEVDEEFYIDNDVNMLLLFTGDGDSEYEEAFPELRFVRNDPYSVDVFSKGVSKATGIEILMEKLDNPDLTSYALGDGLNDMEMFDLVDYSIAMGNGVEALKEKADYVTASNLDSGIIQALKYYKLI